MPHHRVSCEPPVIIYDACARKLPYGITRTLKTPIRLHICPVRVFCVHRYILQYAGNLQADNKCPDQNAQSDQGLRCPQAKGHLSCATSDILYFICTSNCRLKARMVYVKYVLFVAVGRRMEYLSDSYILR